MFSSILAEPRRQKQRLSVDPQNVHWRYTSKNNFGKKMLEQMGWKDGKGIGKNEQGLAENVCLKPNQNGKGLGENESGKPESWIAHNEDFALILESLNKEKLLKTKSLIKDEVKSCTPQKTKHVKRNVSVKHLSSCSDYEKAGIFGLSTKNAKETIIELKITETKIKSIISSDKKNGKIERSNESKKTVISKTSMSDYFAAKMQQKLYKSTNEKSPGKKCKKGKILNRK